MLARHTADAQVGSTSVGVQVERMMDLPVTLYDSHGAVTMIFHGGGQFPAGWSDPLCDTVIERSPGCSSLEIPLTTDEQAVADEYLRHCVDYANFKAPLALVLFGTEDQLAARNAYWLDTYYDCMFGKCGELENDNPDMPLLSTLGLAGIQAYADSTLQLVAAGDPIPSYGNNGPGAFDTTVLTRCGTNRTLC